MDGFVIYSWSEKSCESDKTCFIDGMSLEVTATFPLKISRKR